MAVPLADVTTHKSVVDILESIGSNEPDRQLFTFLIDGHQESEHFSYGGLLEGSRTVAGQLREHTEPGDRVLLLFEPGLEYVEAFFGCLYSGRIAVPVYPPNPNRLERTLPRLMHIVEDAQPAAVATTSKIQQLASGLMSGDAVDVDELAWCATDEAEPPSSDPKFDDLDESSVAFLQYTSGSTRRPRGVRVTHGNLLHNVSLIAETLGADRDTVGVSWLPMYHDMGLIGKIITPVVVGCSAVLMSPVDFLRKPVRWLQAISQYGGTVSAAPDFAYGLCVRKVTDEDLENLDLSTWRVALNGAEPVRADTLESFAERFEPAGFRPEAYLPAYGLAESTLLVTGSKGGATTFEVDTASLEKGEIEFLDDESASDKGSTKTLVSSGSVPEGHQEVEIVEPEKGVPLEEGRVGEIWVKGPSVADGYWKQPDESERVFQAKLDGDDPSTYLRTGDLGFRHGDEIVVTGRRSDLMIIRGRNIYPQDVEATVAESHEAVRPGGMAAVSIDADGAEAPVIVAEVERRTEAGTDVDDRRESETLPHHEVDQPPIVREVAAAIRDSVSQEHRIELIDVVLIRPGSVPKTSSGKIQRNKCRKQYLADDLDVLGRVSQDSPSEVEDVPEEPPDISAAELVDLSEEDRIELLEPYLATLAGYILDRSPDRVQGTPLTSLGIDSLTAMEFQRYIEEDLGVRLFPSVLLGDARIRDVAEELAEADLQPMPTEVGGASSEASSELFEKPDDRQKTETITFQNADTGLSPITTTGVDFDLPTALSEEDLPSPDETRSVESSDASGTDQLSWNERGVWLYQKTNPESWALNLYYAAKVHGIRSTNEIETAVHRLLRRHPILRARYPTEDGEPVRVIDREIAPDFERVDAREWSDEKLERALQEEYEEPFDLERQPPVRFRIFERSESPYLCITLHHIGADFWSLDQLVEELKTSLQDETFSAPPNVTYDEYTEWQRQMLDSGRGTWLQNKWAEELEDPPPRLSFPSASGGERASSGYGRMHRSEISPELMDAVREMASREATTPYTLLLAAYQVLLHKWTGQEEFFVGAVAATRTRSFFQDIIGTFVNPLPLRTRLSSATEFDEHLQNTKEKLLTGMDAQEYPLQAMIEQFDVRRSEAGNPLIQTWFASEQPRYGSFELGEDSGGLETVDTGMAGTAFDLSAMVLQGHDRGEIRFQYADQFDDALVEQMADAYVSILRRVIDEPDTSMAELSLLDDRERDRIVDQWGRGRSVDVPDVPVHGMLEKRAAEAPDRTALLFDDGEWSYDELNARANRLARRLLEAGVQPGDRVGVSIERSPALVAALYGVMKAGGTYVALQPSLPDKRIHYISENAGVEIVVTDDMNRDVLEGELISIDALEDANRSAENPDLDVDRDDLAYILYTSGTTGKPKGVMLPHRAVSNLVTVIGDHFPVDEDDVILQKTPYSFDISVSEIFNPIAAGAKIAMTPPGAEQNPEYLSDAIERWGVTVLRMTPTELANLLEGGRPEQCRSVRRVLSCGEALTPAVRDTFFESWDDTELINLWGPTEACVYGSWWECDIDGPPAGVPIGRPLANYTLYALGDTLDPAPVGLQGELYTGGPSLARGYHEMPTKTATAYLPNPFADEKGARMYRTGDVVWWNRDGQLEFVGRVDDQVQLRGMRVELGEIESYLEEVPEVTQAAVRAIEGEDGRTEALVAYVTAEQGVDVEASDLREHLGDYLQKAKIPGRFIQLDDMPRTPSGKIDRSGLPEPAEVERGGERLEPRTETEQVIADIWEQHLELEEVGVRENFFEIGGHSLVAVRIQHEIGKAFDVTVPLDAFFERPTVEEIAGYISSDHSHFEAIQRLEDREEGPLSPGQRRMWFVQHLAPETAAFHLSGVFRLTGNVDEDALRSAFDRLVERHEILRTVFPMRESSPVQRVLDPPEESVLTVVDLTTERRPEQRARVIVRDSIEGAFDLTEDLPMRADLIRLTDREWVLSLVFHHIAMDEWTADILLGELEELYVAELEEREPELDPPRIQYLDYASWRNDQLEGDRFEESLAYWRDHLEGVNQRIQWPNERDRTDDEHPAEYVPIEWSESVSRQFRSFANEKGTSQFVAGYALFVAFLARFTGQRDLTVGLPITMRQHPELQEVVGFFLNTIPLRTRGAGGDSFERWFESAQGNWRASGPHQWVPLDAIVESVGAERSGGPVPLMDVLFWHLPDAGIGESFGNLDADRFVDDGVPEAKVPLEVELVGEEGPMGGHFKYDAGRFDRSSIEKMGEYFERFVEQCLAEPSEPIERHELLDPGERSMLIEEWSTGPEVEVPDGAIHERIEATADEHPDRTALSFDGGTWTYGELNRRANRLAHRLVEAGVGAEPVGVAMSRSPELVAALVGVMKAGAAYVPLKPTLPIERLTYMLRDSGAEHIVVDPTGAEKLKAQREPRPAEIEDDLSEMPGVDVFRFETAGRSERGRETPVGVIVPEEDESYNVRSIAIRLASEYSSALIPERLVEVEEEDVRTDGTDRPIVSPEAIDSPVEDEPSDPPPFDRQDPSETVPTSPDQQRLWLVQRVDSENLAYVVPEVVRLDGDVDLEALRQAGRDVLERHDLLRTRFPGRKGGPGMETIEVDEAFDWEVGEQIGSGDLAETIERFVDDQSSRPFDLVEDAPVRFAALQLEDGSTLLAVLFHQIVTDEWASRVFWRDLEAAYLARSDGEEPEFDSLPVRYADYAKWRRDGSDGADGIAFWKQKLLDTEGMGFWKRILENAPTEIEWPSERKAPEPGVAEHVEFEWDSSIASTIEDWAREQGVSETFVLYAAFASFLAQYTGQADLTIGVPFTHRRRSEFEPLMGLFTNILPVRVRWRPEESYREFTNRIWTRWRDAAARRETPLGEIARELENSDPTNTNPLFDVVFRVVPPTGADREEFAGMAAQTAGERLPHLGTAEARCTLNVGIERRSDDFAGSFAFDTNRLDRSEVDEMVSEFEGWLRENLESPDRAFVDHSRCAISPGTLDAGPASAAVDAATFLDAHEAMEDSETPEENLDVDVDPEQRAYIMYTSGTTGRPKGVEMRHGAVSNLVHALDRRGLFSEDDVVLWKTPYSFDVSVSEIYNALVAGATLVVTDEDAELDPEGLAETIVSEKVTTLRMVPSALGMLLGEEALAEAENLERVVCAGEALTEAVTRQYFERVGENSDLFNLLGATETCVDTTFWKCSANDEGGVAPVGRALENYRMYVLGDDLTLKPAEFAGEFYVGGVSLARSYRNMPARTATSFVPEAHGGRPGSRMYRTGDLVKWTGGGVLEYEGRTDDQLQVRGIRVELGEIEAHLEEAPGVRQAAVRARNESDGRAESLVAYVVGDGETSLEASDMRSHLEEHLRDAVVPGRYIELDELPRNASGKIDRSALPSAQAMLRRGESDPPQTETEMRVAETWKAVLDVDFVGREENFFEIGGNSFTAVKVQRRLQREFGKDLEVAELFENANVRGLAAQLDESPSEASDRNDDEAGDSESSSRLRSSSSD